MLYVLAAIGVVTVLVLLWRMLSPHHEALTGARRNRAPVPPDDNPDFLRELGERYRGQSSDDQGER